MCKYLLLVDGARCGLPNTEAHVSRVRKADYDLSGQFVPAIVVVVLWAVEPGRNDGTLIFFNGAALWDPGGGLRPGGRRELCRLAEREPRKVCVEGGRACGPWRRETFLWSCGSFGIDTSWYYPAFGEGKEPPCLWREEKRP